MTEVGGRRARGGIRREIMFFKEGFFSSPHSFHKNNVHSISHSGLASPKLLGMGSPYVILQICIWTVSEVGNHMLVN